MRTSAPSATDIPCGEHMSHREVVAFRLNWLAPHSTRTPHVKSRSLRHHKKQLLLRWARSLLSTDVGGTGEMSVPQVSVHCWGERVCGKNSSS